jgi:hypothetical protein
MWRNLEQQIGALTDVEEQATELNAVPTSIAGVLRHRLERRSRRVFRSSVDDKIGRYRVNFR